MTPDPAGKPPALDMAEILADTANRVVVCCGAGGVGKTTTAAAMALRAAEYGRTVVVLTIDPARRLAQALGIDEQIGRASCRERGWVSGRAGAPTSCMDRRCWHGKGSCA